jgi:hypothetical protein
MSGGGDMPVKKIPYSEPKGPIGIGHKGVGLGGDNHDCGEEGSNESMSGSPGIGGTNHGNSVNQGRH